MALRSIWPNSARQVTFALSVMGVSLMALLAFAGVTEPALGLKSPGNPIPHPQQGHNNSQHDASLAQFALEKVLGDAAPVFGDYEYVQSNASEW